MRAGSTKRRPGFSPNEGMDRLGIRYGYRF
jgi:hypothetical protein